MTFKVARPNPTILISHKQNDHLGNFKVAIAISKKVSKKSVERNKLRRILHTSLIENFKKHNNHKPYWILVNLKTRNFINNKGKLLEEFQYLILKSGLFK